MALVRKTDIDKSDAIGRHFWHTPIITAVSQTCKVFLLRLVPDQLRVLAARAFCSAYAGTCSILLYNSSGEEILSGSSLAIDATPEKFKTLAKVVLVSGGVVVEKAATTAIVFTAAHVVTASKFGIILVQINKTTGAITTKCPGATQTTPMAYDDAAAALAALPSPAAGTFALGWIKIHNNSGDWTANTDDLTDASDVTTATFSAHTDYEATPLTSITPSALSNVTGTLASNYRLTVGRYLIAAYTTDGSGALTNGALDIDVRPEGMRGDPLFTG